jgi:hypothetical protein
MGIILWIVLFLVLSGICAWIVFGDGVETVAGLVAAILLGADIIRWSDRGIRPFVGTTWVVFAIWFILGLLEPGLGLSEGRTAVCGRTRSVGGLRAVSSPGLGLGGCRVWQRSSRRCKMVVVRRGSDRENCQNAARN